LSLPAIKRLPAGRVNALDEALLAAPHGRSYRTRDSRATDAKDQRVYADQTLTPKEAIRLCALGTLAQTPMTYRDLAVAIRHFVSRVVGPTPEIMGHSIELLRYEALVETVSGTGDQAVLALTEGGRAELRTLLIANLRPSNTELNHLIVALKFRFLHLLAPQERLAQAELLIDAGEQELARLTDLRRHHAGDGGYLLPWLDHDIAQVEDRLAWLARLHASVAAAG
jgi:DNA-binding PadR family transcriptional regulator